MNVELTDYDLMLIKDALEDYIKDSSKSFRNDAQELLDRIRDQHKEEKGI